MWGLGRVGGCRGGEIARLAEFGFAEIGEAEIGGSVRFGGGGGIHTITN